MFYPRDFVDQWQFVKYPAITDYLKKDEYGDNDIDYWGLSAYVWNNVANPKALGWRFDIVFVYCFAFINYEAFAGYFIGSLAIEFVMVSIVFSLWPHLDMPMINWYQYFDNLV